jgi:ketosteroid isomerase-like protein
MPQTDEAADIAAVEAVLEMELSTLVAGDVEANAALLASDAIILPPNEPPVGAAEAAAWSASFLETFNVTAAEYVRHDISIHGDMAVDYYHGELMMAPVGSDEASKATMKGLHILARQADGSWKIVYDIWNSSDPSAGM